MLAQTMVWGSSGDRDVSVARRNPYALCLGHWIAWNRSLISRSLTEEFLCDKLWSKCIFRGVYTFKKHMCSGDTGLQMPFQNDLNDSVMPHCSVSTHCWPENVCQTSHWVYHCFALLFALFMFTLCVLDAGAWHIQIFESSTRQNHTQEDSV